eukprot:GHVU01127788.1.p1 GENE.GHVU01127788.1~~GHVU01127788.1.p1  ORF type:complete len:303 (-),score=46.96 GHVU01127788.1:138-1046(-)
MNKSECNSSRCLVDAVHLSTAAETWRKHHQRNSSGSYTNYRDDYYKDGVEDEEPWLYHREYASCDVLVLTHCRGLTLGGLRLASKSTSLRPGHFVGQRTLEHLSTIVSSKMAAMTWKIDGEEGGASHPDEEIDSLVPSSSATETSPLSTSSPSLAATSLLRPNKSEGGGASAQQQRRAAGGGGGQKLKGQLNKGRAAKSVAPGEGRPEDSAGKAPSPPFGREGGGAEEGTGAETGRQPSLKDGGEGIASAAQQHHESVAWIGNRAYSFMERIDRLVSWTHENRLLFVLEGSQKKATRRFVSR